MCFFYQSRASILILAGVPEILNRVRDQSLYFVVHCYCVDWYWLVVLEAIFARKREEGFDDCDSAANVASVVIGETGPFIRDWVTWNQVFLLIDIVCCCAIIFPIVWSIRSLRETSKTDGKAARNLAKLTLFRQFYIVVIGYLYFTRIVVFALRTISAYKYQRVSNAAEEIASLAFYLVMFYMFRPVEKNVYFVIDEEDEESAQQILQDEEFEL
ncbi:Protein CANDIDATE G-PROTEIN COUPLED REPTOR 7 [Ranunculus cassubicifolius]